MAGGTERSGSKHSHGNYPKRRCCIYRCKKRARKIINKKPYCKIHLQEIYDGKRRT